jgi:NADH dehydrogenase FAD-containing subunit
MSKTASDTRKNVVVVGGGGAGAPIINALSSKLDPMKHNLILITARPFFIHLVAAIRMVVTDEGRIEETALIPYDTNFVNGNGTLKVGTVVGIEKDSKGDVGGEVILESGERIPYTVLALAPGSTWDGPLALPNTKADTIAWLKKWRSMFEKANDIVFAGGGAVGIGTFIYLMILIGHIDDSASRVFGRDQRHMACMFS